MCAGIIFIMWQLMCLVGCPVLVVGFFGLLYLIIELRDADRVIDRLVREGDESSVCGVYDESREVG